MLSFLALMLLIASALGLGGYPMFGERIWFAETFAAFRLQYIALFTLLLLWGLFRQRSGALLGLCLIGVLLNAATVFFALKPNIIGNFAGQVATDVQTRVTAQITQVIPFVGQWLKPRTDTRHKPVKLKLMQMNLYVLNRNHEGAVRFMLDSKADVITLEELNPKWRKAIMTDPVLKKRFPHRLAPYENQLGLLSRYPIVRHRVEMDAAPGAVIDSWLIAQLELTPQKQDSTALIRSELSPLISVMVIHPRHPTSPFGARRQFEVFQSIIANGPGIPRPLLVAGDFNATPWSPGLTMLKHGLQLHDSSEERWPQPSWPTWFWPFRIPIDQILYSDGITVNNRVTGPDYGSDHLPVSIELTVNPS